MAYCTNTDVSSEFKGITFSSSTPVTADEVTEFIAQSDAVIDGYLNNKYVTPITGASSLAIVKMISIYMVSKRVKAILRVKTGGTGETENRGDFEDMAKSLINDLKSSKLNLPDATLVQSGGGIDSYTNTNDVPHIFDRDKDQW